MEGRYRELAVAVVAIAALAVIGATTTDGGLLRLSGTPGVIGLLPADHIDCELLRFGELAQPSNALSALAFVLVGLGVLAGIGRDRSRPAAASPFPVLYGAAAILIGLGSFSFHRAATDWSGWLDTFAVHAFLAVLIAHAVARMRGGWDDRIAAGLAPAVAAIGAVLWVVPNGVSNATMIVLIAAVALAEARLLRQGAVTDRRLLAGALALYGAGLVVFFLSRDGGPWCAPEATIQGHAGWHVLAAAGTWVLYAYLRSERES